MPPKQSTPAATRSAIPPTVTTARGKEYDTTAAHARPRRASTALATATRRTESTARMKRSAVAPEADARPPKKRGRPMKANSEDMGEPPKKRGRSAKAAATDSAEALEPSKKRGRPPKKSVLAVSVDVEKPPPKKRGRPPHGGETTKIDTDDMAAGDQLEEELESAVVGEPSLKPASENVIESGAEPIKRFWLMKAEQEDREETLEDGSVYNSKFTINDLRNKGGPEPWDGVRNPTACRNMREMKLGDLAFFYASGGKQGRVPGIVGIMEVVREHEADPSAFDDKSPYYVKNDKTRGTPDKPRWSMVHVEFRKKLIKPVPLKELQKYAMSGGALSNMQELNAARLSVSKVSADEWTFIVDNLIEGYDDEVLVKEITKDEDVALKTTLPSDSATIIETKEPIDTAISAIGTVQAATSKSPSRANSAKPHSRASSLKPTSRAGSAKPPSHAGSLAPPTGRAASRARSRTPVAGAVAGGKGTEVMASVAEE